MGVFEMIVAVVLIAGLCSIAREFLRKNQNTSTAEIKDLQERLSRLEKLETRVQTLESIVTDEREILKREINALGNANTN